MRSDNRQWNELRPMEAKVGVIKRADGSAFFRIGRTHAYAAVYGPRNLHPAFLRNPKKGVLRCHYNMMPFSGSGNRVRPGGNRRSKEISMLTEKALLPVVNLDDYPNSVVDVFIEFPQTDAGSRCAGICAAAIALADAGVAMRDLVSAVAIGRNSDQILVDVDYKEEAYEDGPVADVPLAIVAGTQEITLLQMDGEIDKNMLLEGIGEGIKACKDISKVQRQALKDKYQVTNNE